MNQTYLNESFTGNYFKYSSVNLLIMSFIPNFILTIYNVNDISQISKQWTIPD